MSFKSDAQRRHFFANQGGSSAGNDATPLTAEERYYENRARTDSSTYGIDVQPGQYVHTMYVNGVRVHVALDEADRSTDQERQEWADKESRKRYDFSS